MIATIPLATAVPVDAGWTFAPIVLLALASYLAIYVWRWRISRAEGGARAAPVGKLVLWITGIGCLFIALVSPIDALGEQLASMHMVQHLLIADLAPICLTLALTKHILRPATRRIQWIERAAGPFGHPAFGVVAYVAAMWIWHIPAMYQAALEHPYIHVLEHLSFAAAGLLYWWHLLSPIRSRMRLGGLGPVLYMASTKILVGFLGILLAFSPDVLYHFYEVGSNSTRWGLSPLDDQRVAGLIMALEQSIVMGIALAYLFVRMLAESEEEEQRAERYGAV
ncbi:cytochrome c oxidase assembly protein [Solirubrobacter soli]|uniref:cytochrome c oxidase assembly protein n=1 Tax=Solirubrobacter soli TaxID=363832 RepID=UPI00146C60E2|nr:cytochrome c oxidase assembly protein [Solirubrobacter soli]